MDIPIGLLRAILIAASSAASCIVVDIFLVFHYVTFLLSANQVLDKNSDHRHITSYYMRMILRYMYLLAETFSGKFCFKLCFVFHAGSGF